MSVLNEIRQLVTAGRDKEIAAKVQQALDEKLPPLMILNDVLIDGMRQVGGRFEAGEIFIPEMVLAARAMTRAVEVLRPHLVTVGVKPVGKLAIGTVQGDLHDIGKSLVMMMCEGQGFEVIDLGVNVAPQKFVDAIYQGADIIC
jgi:5-methyltetrahydrofolate--homocysteine methyltransferase